MNYSSNCLFFCRNTVFLTLNKLLLKNSNFISHKLSLSVELLKVIRRLHSKGRILYALGNLPVSNLRLLTGKPGLQVSYFLLYFISAHFCFAHCCVLLQ